MTEVKTGISVAVIFKLLQPKNAFRIVVHTVVPHCSTSNNLLLFVPLAILKLLKLVGKIFKRMVAFVGKPVMEKVVPEKVPEPVAVPGLTSSQE